MLLQPFDSKGFAERLAAMLARRLEDPSRPPRGSATPSYPKCA
jgi:hypothetical protein